MTPDQQAVIAAARARRQQQPAPEAAPSQSYLSGMIDSVTQGAAMGFGDELTGIESAILGKTPDGGMFDYSQPFGERYSRAVEAERSQQDAFGEANPVSAGVAEVAGALGTGIGAGRAGLTLMGRRSIPAVGGAALEGAGYGALYGAGEADEGDRLEGAAYGGAVGGVTGGAIAGVTQQIAKILGGRRAAAMAPGSQDLKRQGGALIERAAEANPTFEGFDEYVMQAYRHLDNPTQGYDGGSPAFANLRRWVENLEELSTGGTAPTLQQLRMLRARLEPAAANMANPNERRLARSMKEALDNFMDQAASRASANPNNLPAIPGQGVNTAPQSAWDDLVRGRSLYNRGKKGELIDRMFEMAEDRAGSTYSGSNVENAIRQNMRRVLDNDKLRAKFTKDEIDAIRTVVRGEPIQNALRKLGALSPLRGGLMSLLSGGMGGAGMATGNPLMMALPASAAVADALASRGTMSQAQAVSSMVRGGPNAATALMQSRNLPPQMQAIIRALSAQGGAVTQP